VALLEDPAHPCHEAHAATGRRRQQ